MAGDSFKNRELASRAGKMSKPGKHNKTKQWEQLAELITGELTERVVNYLKGMPDEELFKNYLMLLEYFKPKLSRSEVKADIADMGERTINIQVGGEIIDLSK